MESLLSFNQTSSLFVPDEARKFCGRQGKREEPHADSDTWLNLQYTIMIIGLGTDIVEIDRVRSMIDRHGDAFLKRCFTEREIEYADRHRDAAVRFAGRWAAKEAVVKVLGTGFVKGITFHDIEVLPMETGQPRIELTGGAGDIAIQMGIGSVLITISHAKLYATATAVGIAVSG